MLTFKQFIQEEEDLLPFAQHADEVVQTIKDMCGKWLAESGGIPVFRGMKPIDQGGKLFKFDKLWRLQVRKDRKPSDSPMWLHDAMNSNFASSSAGQKFRSTAVFVTASQQVAQSYDAPYVIFPIGDFKYAWSKIIKDATIELLPKIWSEESLREDNELLDDMAPYFDKYAKYSTEVKSIVQRQREIITSNDDVSDLRLYLMGVSGAGKESSVSRSPIWSNFIEYYFKRVDPWQYDNLRSYLTSYPTHELMISCEEYFAVHVKDWPAIKEDLT